MAKRKDFNMNEFQSFVRSRGFMSLDDSRLSDRDMNKLTSEYEKRYGVTHNLAGKPIGKNRTKSKSTVSKSKTNKGK